MMTKGTTRTEYVKWCWSVQNSCCSLACHVIAYALSLIMILPTTKQYYTKAFEDTATWFCLQTDIFFAVFRESDHYSISQEIYTRFLLCCALLWLYIDWFSHIHLTIAPAPAKQPWWIWINTSCELIMNDCITTTKQSTTKPCAYFLGYTVGSVFCKIQSLIIA